MDIPRLFLYVGYASSPGRWVRGLYALAAPCALALVLLAGCEEKPLPAPTQRPLPVKPAPADAGPLAPGPGETASSSLAKKDKPPPYVKIKRDKDGVYTWDISGKDVDDILKVDGELRKTLATGKGVREKGGRPDRPGTADD